jgi:hypothetical protein
MLEILTDHNPIWEIHPLIVIIAEWLTEKMEWYLPQNTQCKPINVGVQSESQALGHCLKHTLVTACPLGAQWAQNAPNHQVLVAASV